MAAVAKWIGDNAGQHKRFMLFVVPVAGIAWFPASLLLGRLDVTFAVLYPLVLIAFAIVVMRVFRRGMRRYESALG